MPQYPIKYLANGSPLGVIEQLPGDRAIVCRVYTVGEEESELEFDERRKFVCDEKLFDAEPVEWAAPTLTRLRNQISELQEKLDSAAAEERGMKDRLKKLKSYAALQRIEDFLDGKITHYVLWDGYCSDLPIPRISTPNDEKCGTDQSCHAKLKLLALYGDKDRSMEWKLNYYSDGSGGHKINCIPCTSLEEATEKAREILAKSFAEYKRPDYGNVVTAERLVKAAKNLGAPIPDGFEAWLKAHEARGFQEMIDKAEKEKQVWQARLDAYNAGVEVPV